MDKKDQMSVNSLLIIMVVIVMLVIAFMAGTIAGFRMAVHQISHCTIVDCTSIGVTDAVNCEVCPEGAIRISGGTG
jgi:hypothetical protein